MLFFSLILFYSQFFLYLFTVFNVLVLLKSKLCRLFLEELNVTVSDVALAIDNILNSSMNCTNLFSTGNIPSCSH